MDILNLFNESQPKFETTLPFSKKQVLFTAFKVKDAKKIALVLQENNKKLTPEQLKQRYGSPTVTNGKWKGYVVIEKEGSTAIFETIKIAAQELKIGYSTLLQAIKRGTGTNRSILHNATIYLKKEL